MKNEKNINYKTYLCCHIQIISVPHTKNPLQKSTLFISMFNKSVTLDYYMSHHFLKLEGPSGKFSFA